MYWFFFSLVSSFVSRWSNGEHVFELRLRLEWVLARDTPPVSTRYDGSEGYCVLDWSVSLPFPSTRLPEQGRSRTCSLRLTFY